MRIYKDSKEFPLANYERIESTSDYRYMIKGYDGEELEADENELKERFNEVVQDYVVSLNSKNFDIVQHGKINVAKLELTKYLIAKEIITLQIRANDLRGENQTDNITELLKDFKIPKTTDLQKQIDVLSGKIEKLKNDINEAEQKLIKNTPQEATDSDINEIITNVELILERGIDMSKTSLYRFGIMQEQARKKIESINKSK